eukprot:scaffold109917_cov52-Prasinocladus_malaysianus.AAC.1
MTKAMREREAQARAVRMSPIPVKIVIPGHYIVQANFRATDDTNVVQTFIHACLRPEAPKWYLFTSPPKQIVSPGKTLFAAGLVPAAKIFLGFEEKGQHKQAQTTLRCITATCGILDTQILKDEVLKHGRAEFAEKASVAGPGSQVLPPVEPRLARSPESVQGSQPKKEAPA